VRASTISSTETVGGVGDTVLITIVSLAVRHCAMRHLMTLARPPPRCAARPSVALHTRPRRGSPPPPFRQPTLKHVPTDAGETSRRPKSEPKLLAFGFSVIEFSSLSHRDAKHLGGCRRGHTLPAMWSTASECRSRQYP